MDLVHESSSLSGRTKNDYKGLGYDSFADAVAAYNKQYGTDYTVESVKEALGQ